MIVAPCYFFMLFLCFCGYESSAAHTGENVQQEEHSSIAGGSINLHSQILEINRNGELSYQE